MHEKLNEWFRGIPCLSRRGWNPPKSEFNFESMKRD